jgi:hypothetical protein
LIVDDGEQQAAAGAPDPRAPSAREMLGACVREAERHADALGSLDAAVGRILATGTVATELGALQGLDLLRQEAEALSRVLRLVATADGPDQPLDAQDLVACVPVAAQRARLMS